MLLSLHKKSNKLRNIIIIIIILTLIPFSDIEVGIALDCVQVKTKNSDTIYFLDHKRHKKKAYVNELSYLIYGNRWLDIKLVDEKELELWDDIKLVKGRKGDAIYYINAGKKALIKNDDDFYHFRFRWDDVVTIHDLDLAQYKLVDYDQVGLNSETATFRTSSYLHSENKLNITSATLSNKLISFNTQANLIGDFVFESGDEPVNIYDIKLNLKGLYREGIFEKVFIENEEDGVYYTKGHIDGRTVTFYFRDGLKIAPHSKKNIKVYADFSRCDNCGNNSLELVIDNKSDINANVKMSGLFPIKSESLGFVYSEGIIGVVLVEELEISNMNFQVGKANALIGRYKITETDSNEDMRIEEIAFKNNDSGRYDNLKNFKLRNENGDIISSVDSIKRDNIVRFKLDNFTVKEGKSKIIKIYADIVNDRRQFVNFDLEYIKAVGDRYNYQVKYTTNNLNDIQNITFKDTIAIDNNSVGYSANFFNEVEGKVIGSFQIRDSKKNAFLKSVFFDGEKNINLPILNGKIYLVKQNDGEVIESFLAKDIRRNDFSVDLDVKLTGENGNLYVVLIYDGEEDVCNVENNYGLILKKLEYEVNDRQHDKEIDLNIFCN
ncbi:hypothetical protein KAI92_03200 [Candidatus Parcubacteria bacterium]|nr:hypothetical protein [Candidatus Parcubacteria bacterium]